MFVYVPLTIEQIEEDNEIENNKNNYINKLNEVEKSLNSITNNIKDIKNNHDNLFAICSYIILKSEQIEKPINNLKLQKILYYSQIEYVKRYNKLLFDEDIEITTYGMRIPIVYNRFNQYSSAELSHIIKEVKEYNNNLEKDKVEILNYVINKYKNYLTWDMVELNYREQLYSLYKNKLPYTIKSKELLELFKLKGEVVNGR